MEGTLKSLMLMCEEARDDGKVWADYIPMFLSLSISRVQLLDETRIEILADAANKAYEVYLTYYKDFVERIGREHGEWIEIDCYAFLDSIEYQNACVVIDYLLRNYGPV